MFAATNDSLTHMEPPTCFNLVYRQLALQARYKKGSNIPNNLSVCFSSIPDERGQFQSYTEAEAEACRNYLKSKYNIESAVSTKKQRGEITTYKIIELTIKPSVFFRSFEEMGFFERIKKDAVELQRQKIMDSIQSSIIRPDFRKLESALWIHCYGYKKYDLVDFEDHCQTICDEKNNDNLTELREMAERAIETLSQKKFEWTSNQNEHENLVYGKAFEICIKQMQIFLNCYAKNLEIRNQGQPKSVSEPLAEPLEFYQRNTSPSSFFSSTVANGSIDDSSLTPTQSNHGGRL